MKWSIPVSWEMCGTVTVHADTLDEAMEVVRNDDSIPLPDDGEYIDGSWSLCYEEEEIVRQCFNYNQPDRESEKGIENE